MPLGGAGDAAAPERREPVSAPGVLTNRPWSGIPAPDRAVTAALGRAMPLSRDVSEHMLHLLAARGLDDPADLDRFFFPSLDHTNDPLALDEMEAAVRRVLAAAAGREAVAVHGDFDVDGLTGTAVLASFFSVLEHEGGRVRLEPPFVPDRIVDGYGVSLGKVREWVGRGVDLLVTVDTGAAAHAELDVARAGGMDVVVLDHHLFADRPAGAGVLVNPSRVGNRYPNPELCGAAVAFKLVQATAILAPGALPAGWAEEIVDLVALGLVADQMPLVGENRTLVQCGLKRLNERSGRRPGLDALLGVTGLDRGFPVSSTDIAYQIAPRLNACGRVGRVDAALGLLLCDDPGEARALATEADRSNEKRKELDQRMKTEALDQAKPYMDHGDDGLVLASPDWHKGIIGISASRLVEVYNVPTILFAVEGGEARGSARSVPGVDVKAALDRCAGLLRRYGGHAQAAGLTLAVSDLDAFREAFLKALADTPAGDVVPEAYDLILPLDRMSARDTADLLGEIQLLAPFGEGHRAPVFRADGLRLKRMPTPLGRGGEHLRFAFRGPRDGGEPPALGREFICFGCGRAWNAWVREQAEGPRAALGTAWDVLFQINPNTWRPRDGRSVDPVQQLLVDIKPAVTS